MKYRTPTRRKLRHQVFARFAGATPASREEPRESGRLRDRSLTRREASPARAGSLSMLQDCPDAVLAFRDGCVCYANTAAARLYRAQAAADLLGMHWHRLVAAEAWEAVEPHLAHSGSDTSGAGTRMEIAARAVDGSHLAVDSGCTRVLLEGGPAVLLVQRDLGPRLESERATREQHARAEQLMQERTEELRQALADARLAETSKDAFMANFSHELRTPLAGMLGLIDLSLGRCTDPAVRTNLEKMARAGKHVSRIINDLLDLSKIGAGRMVIESIPFSLREALLHTREMTSHRAEVKGLDISFRVDNDVPDALVGDPLRIKQVLLNLVGNAIKFTHAGHVMVRISLSTLTDDHVRLSCLVEDTGIGLSAEEIAGIFQPFAQATAATCRKYGGTGLGLALSQRLAESMDGQITVRSQKGWGSNFTFSLRLPLADGATARPEPAPEGTDYSRARVLIVEDNLLGAEIVSEMLQEVGIAPQIATNGHEALAILANEGPKGFDLVLMDLQMPVLDGHAATRVIRSWPGYSQLPIVALSAHALEHERGVSLAVGMNGHLTKPVSQTAFRAMLDKWLPWSPAAEAAAPPPPGAAAPDAATLDEFSGLACLDANLALERFGGNRQRYRHWLAKYVAESAGTGQEIRRLLFEGDNAKAAATVHGFKGMVGTLGLTDLHARAAALEKSIRSGLDAVPELRQLERAIEETRREIGAALKR